MADSLLPPNATPWMRAVEAASATAWPTPVHLLADFSDPAACPSHLLADLAFESSVDIWDETWSEAKKRSVIARSVELHRLKGTLAGIRAYVEIAGGEIRRALTPPQGVFAEGRDESARDAWLARLPEFRVFTNTPWGHDAGDAFPVEAFGGGEDDDGWFPPISPDARIQTRAGLLIQDGVEYAMSRREQAVLLDGAERLIETFAPTAQDKVAAYADQAWPGDFLDRSPTLPALTLSLDPASGSTGAVIYRGPFVDATPERVRDQAVDRAGAYAGFDYLDGAFADRGLDPAVLTYDRWRLTDPKRSAGAVVPGEAYFGDQTYLGLPAYTLLLDIKVDETAPTLTAFCGGFVGDYPAPHDARRTNLVLDGVRSAAADRDQVLVRFARHRPQRLGDRPTLPVRLGQLVTDF